MIPTIGIFWRPVHERMRDQIHRGYAPRTRDSSTRRLKIFSAPPDLNSNRENHNSSFERRDTTRNNYINITGT